VSRKYFWLNLFSLLLGVAILISGIGTINKQGNDQFDAVGGWCVVIGAMLIIIGGCIELLYRCLKYRKIIENAKKGNGF
jgi:hypothetical protein